ncbi:DUF1127 domain-containing protein [Paracoccus sp. 1_MG-2023]|uniref:DUF1127 domain-containing protein n=1 Tax=unclassified Paracoccus (in: a-proteobacteria) TaxID=2688777 RepID=UPI001C08A370|nr:MULTISPECIES: DUF1127 domain-containing protein [unclassified Paracoccus (in: a-proteobacteria)]MBU2956596.1 DUF1127 domain-containing protein [Paracoccus sp. C2R09]MDO6668702.1 DUF1127 domain-containing protein [Paracoccus sp. 1_MG-2023]
MASIVSAESKTNDFSAAMLLAPFRALGRAMVALAEASPQMRALDRLSRFSDEELAERGMTRESEVRRILGGAAGL